jgi:hypothetical protein
VRSKRHRSSFRYLPKSPYFRVRFPAFIRIGFTGRIELRPPKIQNSVFMPGEIPESVS